MYYIGIDLGGTNIAAGIVNDDFTILKKASTPTMATREPSAILDDMQSFVTIFSMRRGSKWRI